MPTNTERRTNAVLALIDAHQNIDNISDITEHMPHKEREDYCDQIIKDYNAAITEYEAAHAPTADEIKNYLLEHLGADVKVYFAGGEVSVGVGLEWVENGEITERFGHDQDDDYDNQHTG